MAKGPLVSVILPVYNGQTYLAESIESILKQEYEPLEIILVDDGSTDNTRAVASRYTGKLRYFYQSNQGVAAARNHGLKMMRGEIVGFQDADDIWTAKRLERQIRLLEEDPELQVVLGLIQRIRPSRIPGQPFEHLDEQWVAPNINSAVFRRSLVDQIGPFNEKLVPCDDVDWLMRIRESGVKQKVLNEITLYYRRHEENATNDEMFGNRSFLKTLQASIKRRKAEGKGAAANLSKLSEFKEKGPKT